MIKQKLGVATSVVLTLIMLVVTPGCQVKNDKTDVEFSDCEGCPTMVVIPAGSFLMGSLEGEDGRPEGPIHEVNIEYEFAAGKYEVTIGQYADFVRETDHTSSSNCVVWTDKWEALEDTSWRNPGFGRAPLDNEPVGCVNWHDAKAYVAWVSDKTQQPYRLLSEAEWEYAARGGATTRFFWGDSTDEICKYVNLFDVSGTQASDLVYVPAECDDGYPFTAPVGSFQPNPFGLYDIIGNVWEWTEDCYTVPYPLEPVDGSSYQAEGICEKRSIRGGSWITTPSRQRAAFRGRDPEAVVFTPFGFRVARDLK